MHHVYTAQAYDRGCSDLVTSAQLAQSVEHETLNLRVVGSSPTLGDLFKYDIFSDKSTGS